MPPEDKELLDKSIALAEENNKMLHSLVRHMRISRMMTILYWVLIVGSVLGALYFIQPFVDQVVELYGGAKSNLESFGDLFGGEASE